MTASLASKDNREHVDQLYFNFSYLHQLDSEMS